VEERPLPEQGPAPVVGVDDELEPGQPQQSQVGAQTQQVVYESWTLPGGPPCGYPALIVDPDHERREWLRRLEMLRR